MQQVAKISHNGWWIIYRDNNWYKVYFQCLDALGRKHQTKHYTCLKMREAMEYVTRRIPR